MCLLLENVENEHLKEPGKGDKSDRHATLRPAPLSRSIAYHCAGITIAEKAARNDTPNVSVEHGEASGLYGEYITYILTNDYIDCTQSWEIYFLPLQTRCRCLILKLVADSRARARKRANAQCKHSIRSKKKRNRFARRKRSAFRNDLSQEYVFNDMVIRVFLMEQVHDRRGFGMTSFGRGRGWSSLQDKDQVLRRPGELASRFTVYGVAKDIIDKIDACDVPREDMSPQLIQEITDLLAIAANKDKDCLKYCASPLIRRQDYFTVSPSNTLLYSRDTCYTLWDQATHNDSLTTKVAAIFSEINYIEKDSKGSIRSYFLRFLQNNYTCER